MCFLYSYTTTTFNWGPSPPATIQRQQNRKPMEQNMCILLLNPRPYPQSGILKRSKKISTAFRSASQNISFCLPVLSAPSIWYIKQWSRTKAAPDKLLKRPTIVKTPCTIQGKSNKERGTGAILKLYKRLLFYLLFHDESFYLYSIFSDTHQRAENLVNRTPLYPLGTPTLPKTF